jgi:glycosyltransferase involved in cell wall biosynthesis
MAEFTFSCPKILPIYNWVDPNVFSPRESKHPHSPFRLLFVGSMNTRKGSDLLAQIMISLGSDYELRCVCDRKALPHRLAHIPNVIALGRMDTVQELADTYRTSDALLFPSRLEGFGLVALEAQSCGIPVIATNGSSLPEVVQNGVTGLLCPQDDVEAFANAARKLSNNINLWRSMCQAASLQVQSKFNEDESINTYMQIYRNLSV